MLDSEKKVYFKYKRYWEKPSIKYFQKILKRWRL